MKTVIPEDMCQDEWRMQELNKLRPVIDFIIANPMPELVLGVFHRMQWITDLATADEMFSLAAYIRHDIAMADTIGLIAERLGQKGIKPDMKHPMLSPLMDYIDNAEWKTMQEIFEAWYESDLTKILPYLEKKLSHKK